MPIPTAARWLLCLCVLPSLIACGLLPKRPAVVTRPEVIEVPMLAYRPLPDALTQPLSPPPAPPRRCQSQGRAVPCVDAVIATIPAWQAILDQCNADRRRSALLGTTDGVTVW